MVRCGKLRYRGLDLVVLKSSLNRWQEALAETGWNSLYWNDHDQPRVVSRFGDNNPKYWSASAKALATVLHGHARHAVRLPRRGTRNTNYPFPDSAGPQDMRPSTTTRVWSSWAATRARRWPGLAKISRDNARTPMQWDASRTPDSARGSVAAGQPQLHVAERRRPDRHGGFGFRALPGSPFGCATNCPSWPMVTSRH